jgi:hypothetical protein
MSHFNGETAEHNRYNETSLAASNRSNRVSYM